MPLCRLSVASEVKNCIFSIKSFDTLVKLPVCQWSVNVIKGFVFEYSAEAGQAQNENVMVKTKVRFHQRNLLLTKSQNWCTNHLALTD